MSEKKEYIERGALIGAIEATEFLTMQDAATTLQLVTEAPAADVDPVVRGEWQKVYENTTFGAMYRCSTCGETTFNVENCKYCPKCGAHMERSGSGE